MLRRIPGVPGLLLTAAFLSPVIGGCGGGENITSFEGNSTVTLGLTGLGPLTGGLNYQAWLVVGTPTEFWGYPLVLFNVNEAGEMVSPAGDSILAGPFEAGVDASGVIGIGISLEESDVLLNYSSYTFILGGEMVGGSAELSTESWLAFDQSLSEAAGRYILATPTDDDPANELGGIWFMDSSVAPAARGLLIPDAPTGWNYESWVVLNDQPLSMGKFVSPAEPDSANPHSGTAQSPAFPGEDFLTAAPAGITFPADLAGAPVFITLEPWAEMDTEPENPFFLRIFGGSVPADPTAETPYELTSFTDQLPRGTASIQGT